MKNVITLVIWVLCCHYSAVSNPQISKAPGDSGQIRSNLYIISPNGDSVLMDGNLTQYSSTYSNALDGMDARKMSNPSENWGLLRDNTVLVIERRHSIEGNDSIFFKMWNMRVITYRIQFITSNLNSPGMQGILEDTYLKTSTPIDLNGTTDVDFSVTSDPASMASDRFTLIFSDNVPQAPPLPHYLAVGAFVTNDQVNINWQTGNASQWSQFDIERSDDKINFISINTLKAYHTITDYHWLDANPGEGIRYYRIGSVDISGNISYSDTMEIAIIKERDGIGVYPNPATINNFNLRISNQQAGRYNIKLVNSSGQVFMTKIIQYSGGSIIEKLEPPQNILPGIYHLEIKMPGNLSKVISVVF